MLISQTTHYLCEGNEDEFPVGFRQKNRKGPGLGTHHILIRYFPLIIFVRPGYLMAPLTKAFKEIHIPLDL